MFLVNDGMYMRKFILDFLFGVFGDWCLEFEFDFDFDFELEFEFVFEVLLYCFDGRGCCKFIDGFCKGGCDFCDFKNGCLWKCEVLFCDVCCCMFIWEWIVVLLFLCLVNFWCGKFFVLIGDWLGFFLCVVGNDVLYLLVVRWLFWLVVWVVKFCCNERVIFVNNCVGIIFLGILLGIFIERGSENLVVEEVCLLLICGIL